MFCRIEFYINLYMNHVIKLIINKIGKYIEKKQNNKSLLMKTLVWNDSPLLHSSVFLLSSCFKQICCKMSKNDEI